MLCILYYRSLDYCYLQFVAEVTEDALKHGVLTGPAFDLLCKTHIDRHKHRLREVSVNIQPLKV